MRNMKIRYISFLLISFVLCLDICASIEVRSIHMTTNDGVANNSIRCMLQDSKGFIWMGTLNGLSRYDGNSFVTFHPGEGDKISLCDHRIRSLYEDKNGFLWVETFPERFSCYDLKKDCFVDFTGCGEYDQNYSNLMTASNGDIWLWQAGNGCRKITYANGKFSSITFKKEKGNLPFNKVTYMYEDKHKNIWIGGEKGIAVLIDNKVTIIEKGHDAFNATSYLDKVFFVSSNGIIYVKAKEKQVRTVVSLSAKQGGTAIYGTLRLDNDWIIFAENGGYVFHLNTEQINREAKFDIPKGEVQTDNRGNFWVNNCTGKVWYINAKDKTIKTFQLLPRDKVRYIDRERYYIIQDSRNIVWIATYGNGLFAYDPTTDELQHFTSNINSFNHIGSNFLQYLMEDRAGGIWVSSEYTGISRLSVLNEGSTRLFPEDKTLSDRSNTIRMITRMSDNEIWIGTRRGGVYKYDSALKFEEEKQYFHSNIYAVTEDAKGTLWLGSRGNGLSIDGKWYQHSNASSSIGNNSIFAVYRDRKGRMWIGTFGGGLDLAIKTKNGYTFKHFLNKNYSQSQIRVIQEDKNGWIWVGTSEGVCIFKPDSLIANPQSYYTYNYDNGKLRSNEVKCIFQDSKGYIWIGTSGTGFSKCFPNGDYSKLSFKHYGTNDGLVNNMVQSFLEDKEGRIWIATEYGISRFSPITDTFENFFFSTYTLGNVYSENSACRCKDGKLLFGTNYGLVIITPEKVINKSEMSPKVVFTNLQVNGIYMHPGDTDSPLTCALTYTNKVKLKYFQNSFVVNFTTFDYSGSNGDKYTYYLENYDKEWNKPTHLNFSAYKNLEPGSYTLHVRACSTTGVWGKEQSVLHIIIAPPFWKTTWAFVIYIFLLLIALYITYRLVRDFNALRTKVQVEKQLTEYKLMFFTNISHEFRTPLTLIEGALEKMRRVPKLPKEINYSMKIMDKSTQRMLRLINQLLEFRKMQNNKLALSLEETDVMAFLHEIFLSFNDIAESKHMDFQFRPSVAFYKMFIDKGNLDKVIYNLLSNAFKYTPSDGKVILSAVINETQKQIVIAISDTGVGIAKEKQGELFKRFMQSNFSGSSMGIGLHLTHELVNVHKGTIVYNENEGGGSVFTVTLSTDANIYEEKDFLIPHNILLKEEEDFHKENATIEEEITEAFSDNDNNTETNPLNKYKILIIEDDHDVREFVKEELSRYFEVVAEADGSSGLEQARTYDADLIICDVLMPGMTGFEVTRKLKNDFNTSHIPIILLTAMSSAESHLEGVESGADAYITKPFSTKLLLARTFKLIEQRENLRKKFSNDPGMLQPNICTSDKDKEFSDRLFGIIEQQIGNSQFSVDDLASTMGLGRTMFYRKVRGITGYSPNEYIRIMRMKKAAELLLEGRYTVSEVSYKVGIEDPFYFSKCFKKQFGISPSAYAHGERKN